MHWKGNCVQPQVRNVRGVEKKVTLQPRVEASLKMQTFIWFNSISGKDQAHLSLTSNG